MVRKITHFTQGLNFSNAIKVTFAACVPVIAGAQMGYFEAGFAIALGALLVFPSDVAGHLKHKVAGIAIAALIVAGSAFVVNIALVHDAVFYAVLAVTLFLLSMISAYGQRATMVSFSGLLSVSLAFSTSFTLPELITHCLLMLAGGLFYLAVSLMFHFARPHRYAELQLAECMRLTAKYLKFRGDLWAKGADRVKIAGKQLELQVELNTIHENIRETVIRGRTSEGTSDRNRRMLIIFISLVEILELALANAFDHPALHRRFGGHNVLAVYRQLAYNLGSTLKKLASAALANKRFELKHNLREDLDGFERSIADYAAVPGPETAEGVIILNALLHYAEKQVEKIMLIARSYSRESLRHDVRGADRDLEKFLTPQHYFLSILWENMSLKSSVFRHSLRLTTTIIAGFVIGNLLPLQNVYWILLTIVVIMRPGYGLTKERSYQRIIGTILGGFAAFGILLLVDNNIAIAAMAIVAMILGFAFSQTNYKAGATFVTIYVVFLYAMLTPDVRSLVQYRILDTVAGAGLAFAANYLLWPSWEFLAVRAYLEKAVAANGSYLGEIMQLYHAKGDVPVSYRLARKAAFIETGNLMASYQRMAQEPKSKQKHLTRIYKIAVLNHSLLSTAAALGTFIQSHTMRRSAAIDKALAASVANLGDAEMILSGKGAPAHREEVRLSDLRQIRRDEIQRNVEGEIEQQAAMQRADLVLRQLVWLIDLTANIRRAAETFGEESDHPSQQVIL